MEAEAREREFERALEARAFRKKPEKADKAGKAVFEFGSDLSASESREEGISARDVQGLRCAGSESGSRTQRDGDSPCCQDLWQPEGGICPPSEAGC
ncbi:unnamed protein product, partial [Brenthis ino]